MSQRRGRGPHVRALGDGDERRRRRGGGDRELGLPIFAKLSPNTFEVVDVARAAVAAGATGLTLVNTLLGLAIDADTRTPRLGGVTGGYSGTPIKPVALRVVYEVARALPGMPVIGTGGTGCGPDAIEMMMAGASAVGVGTVSFQEPRAVNRIHDEVVRWCERHDVGRVVGPHRHPATSQIELRSDQW